MIPIPKSERTMPLEIGTARFTRRLPVTDADVRRKRATKSIHFLMLPTPLDYEPALPRKSQNL
jgi:hypothetical protein